MRGGVCGRTDEREGRREEGKMMTPEGGYLSLPPLLVLEIRRGEHSLNLCTVCNFSLYFFYSAEASLPS